MTPEERDTRARIVAESVRGRLIAELASRAGPPGAPTAPGDIAAAASQAAADAVRNLPDPLQSDAWIYRIVVGGLVIGLLACVALIGVLSLSAQKLDVPNALVAIASAALGALTGLLAPSPVRGQG